MCNQSRFLIIFIFLLLSANALASLPNYIYPIGERMVVVDPRQHRWGAYTSDGMLVRSGIASTGKNYCADMGRVCRTRAGDHRVYFMGDADCYSTRFPIPRGGAPMPYCMYFSENQALHGSYQVASAHLSHGCVRLKVSDARWLRYNFVQEGTLVRVLPY